MRIRTTAVLALIPLLGSCASSGLYYMSDDWCATHLDASAAQCPREQKRLVDTDGQSVPNKEIAQRN